MTMFENPFSLTKWEIIFFIVVMVSIPIALYLSTVLLQGAIWVLNWFAGVSNQPCLPCGGL
jgi:hypothetical protein